MSFLIVYYNNVMQGFFKTIHCWLDYNLLNVNSDSSDKTIQLTSLQLLSLGISHV